MALGTQQAVSWVDAYLVLAGACSCCGRMTAELMRPLRRRSSAYEESSANAAGWGLNPFSGHTL